MKEQELQEIKNDVISLPIEPNKKVRVAIGMSDLNRLISTIEAQAKELEQLKEELKETEDWEADAYAWRDFCEKETAESEQLSNQLKEAEKALEWYADKQTYEPYGFHEGIPVLNDGGEKARQALSHIQGKET